MSTRLLVGALLTVLVLTLAWSIQHDPTCHTEAVHAESGQLNAEVCR